MADYSSSALYPPYPSPRRDEPEEIKEEEGDTSGDDDGQGQRMRFSFPRHEISHDDGDGHFAQGVAHDHRRRNPAGKLHGIRRFRAGITAFPLRFPLQRSYLCQDEVGGGSVRRGYALIF